MLTIKQLQTPTKYTNVSKYTKTNTLPCFKCKKVSNEAIKCVHHDLYNSETQICCVHCWDQESWECPHCNQTPSDEDCISCWKCGQWAHTNCKVLSIEATDDYVCNTCKHAGGIIDTLSFQKIACVTKLEVASNEFQAKTKQFNTDITERLTIELSAAFEKERCVLKQSHEKSLQKCAKTNNELSKKIKAYAKTNNELSKKINKYANLKKEHENKIRTMGASLKARSETVRQMKTLASEKNNAIRALQASNSRNLDANQEIVSLKNKNKELGNQVMRLASNGKKNNKRGRECEQMLEEMQRLVKKYRARWNYNPPTKLSDVDHMLWNTYKCKTDGSSFSADKLLCNGTPPSWESLQKTLDTVKTYHIQRTMQAVK